MYLMENLNYKYENGAKEMHRQTHVLEKNKRGT